MLLKNPEGEYMNCKAKKANGVMREPMLSPAPASSGLRPSGGLRYPHSFRKDCNSRKYPLSYNIDNLDKKGMIIMDFQDCKLEKILQVFL
jgi:hypothetical protein